MKNRIYTFIFAFALALGVSAQTNKEVSDRQIGIPLLEIEDFFDLTPQKMDEIIAKSHFASDVKKTVSRGRTYYSRNLEGQHFAFHGLEAYEVETTFDEKDRIFATYLRLKCSATNAEEATARLLQLAKELNKSKDIKTKLPLNCAKDLSYDELYATDFFQMTADTYAAAFCGLSLRMDGSQKDLPVMTNGVNMIDFHIKLRVASYFKRSGKDKWVSISNPLWEVKGKYLK